MIKKFIAIWGAALALALSTLTLGASPAAAVDIEEYLALTYNSWGNGAGCFGDGGSHKSFYSSDGNLYNDHFGTETTYPCPLSSMSGSTGYGQVIKNNSGGARNNSHSNWRVYFNSVTECGGTWCGTYDSVGARSLRFTLRVTYNENASARKL